MTNIKDCLARGFIKEGETPLEVAAQQLIKDKINVLHTIGGDDTNTQAAELSKYILDKHGGKVVVIGMPKTIDNDGTLCRVVLYSGWRMDVHFYSIFLSFCLVYPIHQTFGADTAAHQGALYFENIVSESTANPRMLILHECMGRDSGYLTAATALCYRERLSKQTFVEGFTTSKESRDVHAIWIPEVSLDLKKEAARLKQVMDKYGCVNVFFGEGTGIEEIVKNMEAAGEQVPRDAFGHVALAKINPGAYFSSHLSELVGAEKTLVQKSGYFARAAAANGFDRDLIGKCAQAGVASAIEGVSGCMGQDEDKKGMPIRAIEFERIKGGKPFDIKQEWFVNMMKDIGQSV